MGYNYICVNDNCEIVKIEYKAKDELRKCPKCNEEMILSNEPTWLVDLAADDSLWAKNFEEYPSVIAYEYKNLKRLCKKNDFHGACKQLILCFEVLLKLETLMACAWVYSNMNEEFINNYIAPIMKTNLSFGHWCAIANNIIKGLRKEKKDQIDSFIPLSNIVDYYRKIKIVSWRNEKDAHGPMVNYSDENFQDEYTIKTGELRQLLNDNDEKLRKQILKVQNDTCTIVLKGAENAKYIKIGERICVDIINENNNDKLTIAPFFVAPFIRMLKGNEGGFSACLFDNQIDTEISRFFSYSDGISEDIEVTDFKNLKYYYDNNQSKHTRFSGIDDSISRAESKEFDNLSFSIEKDTTADYLIEWTKKCIENNEKGVFFLKMSRGMGKSHFAESIDCLRENPNRVSENLDVRTFHLGQSQIVGLNNMLSLIEDKWSTDYINRNMHIKNRVRDYIYEGYEPSAAFAQFLADVRGFTERVRDCNRIMLVLDGVDEINDSKIADMIPASSELPLGVYIMLTGRSDVEFDYGCYSKNYELKSEKTVSFDSDENRGFLEMFYKKKVKRTIRRIVCFDELYEKSEHKSILEASDLSKDVLSTNNIVETYCDKLQSIYESDYYMVKKAIAILLYLGKYEALSLKVLEDLLEESGDKFKVLGMIRSLAPFISVTRSERGNVYEIVNEDIAKELKKIVRLESYFEYFEDKALKVLTKGELIDYESGGMALISHIFDVVGNDRIKVMIGKAPDLDEKLTGFAQIISDNANSVAGHKRLLDILNQLYKLRVCERGERDKGTLLVKSFISEVYRDLGRPSDNLMALEEVYNDYITAYGEGDPEAIEIESSLAGALSIMGSKEKALELYRDVHGKQVKKYGEKSKEANSTLIEIACILNRLGDYEQAEKAFRDLFILREEVFSADPLTKARFLHDYAIHLQDIRRYEEALSIFQEAYALQFSLKDENDLDTNITLNQIGNLLVDMGRFEEAEEKTEIAYNRIKEKYGQNHPNAIICKGNYARALLAQGKVGEAKAIYEKLYEDTREIYGDQHDESLTTLQNIAGAYKDLGELDKAFELFKKCYEELCKFGRNHTVNALSVQEQIVELMLGRGEYREALLICEDLFHESVKLFGEYDDRLIYHQRLYAAALLKNRKYKEALEKYKSIYSKVVEKYGPNHELARMDLKNLNEIRKHIKANK